SHEGAHTIQVRATDAANNQNTSAVFSFTVDTKEGQPTVALAHDTTNGAAGHNTDKITSDASITVSGQDADATLTYSVDGGAFASSYNPASLTDGSHEGAHTIQVRATDAANNQNTSAVFSFTVDTKEGQPTVALANDTTDGAAGHNTHKITADALIPA